MKWFLIGLTIASATGFGPETHAADAPLIIDLWPDKVPGGSGERVEEKVKGKKPGRSITDVSKPTISVYRPDRGKDSGVAVVIAPGGGYRVLAWDHEGEDVAAWLNSIGVTGVLLKYRVPSHRESSSGDIAGFGPLQDAQRALSLVRARAKEWGIEPDKIGMLGFSAGGNLTALAATNDDRRAYEAVDEADQVRCRPDFAALIYPGGIVSGASKDSLIPAVRVTKDSPPSFFVHASDDRGSSENSIAMYLALKRAGVPAEMHIYATGGHGFGMRPSKDPCSDWPKRCEEWMRSQKILKEVAGK